MQETDYYQVLRVSEKADQKEIKEAYRRLAFQYHPDRNQAPESGAQMKAINEAYAVLSNPAKRRDYDAMRRDFGPSAYSRFRSTYTENDIFRGSDVNHIFEEMARAFGFRGFDEIFEEAYGRGYRAFEFRRAGFFARGFLFRDTPAQVRVSPMFSGKLPGYLFRKLLGVELPEAGVDVRETIELTPQEATEGGPYPYFYRKKSKKLVVKLPPRLKERQQIRLAGMGEEGKGGGKSGDLYLKVKIHRPLLERVKNFFSSFGKQLNLPRP
jgi:DnaJ-class molecular chaperone